MPDYIVKQGDCISSIAEKHGLFWDKLWNHPKNANLKEKRTNPNVLHPGDVIFIPEKEEKMEIGATEQRHRFKRKGVPALIRIALVDINGKPRGNEPYTIDIDGTLISGKTKEDGKIEHTIPPNAKTGTLRVGTEGNETYTIRLGHLDPVSAITGIQSRLKNLGFDCGEVNGIMGPETQSALRAFQRENLLEETGNADEATLKKLEEIHGS